MKYAVIVCSRTPRLFERLLKNLGPLPGSVPRVLVILQEAECSQEDRILLMEKAHEQAWEVLLTSTNVGFSAGVNRAAALVPGHDLILLNDDIIPKQGLVPMLAVTLSRAQVVGARILRSDGSVDHVGCALEPDARWRHLTGPPEIGGAPMVEGVTFAAVAIQRDLFDDVDGLNEDLYYACEDHDFCLRALEQGAVIRCQRDAVAIHDQSQTRDPSEVDGPAIAQMLQIWPDHYVASIVAGYDELARGLGEEVQR
jgi:GT2 family glycosyltransferase